MKRFCYIFALTLVSCGIDVLDDQFELPWTEDIVVLNSSRVSNSTPNTVDFELDFTLFQAKIFYGIGGTFGAQEAIDDIIVPYMDLPVSAIAFNEIEGESFTFTIDDLTITDASSISKTPFTVGLLLDSSEPDLYAPYGFQNMITESLIGMIKLAQPDDEFLIGKFKRQYAEDPAIQFLDNSFTTYDEDLALKIADIPKSNSGYAPLYDAIYEMIDLLSDGASHADKHLIVYTYSLDNGSVLGLNAQDIIDKANLAGVKISIIWYSDSGISDWQVVAKIPMLTGGFSVYVRNADGVSTTFLRSLDVLRGNFPYYTLKGHIEDSNSAITSPFDYQNYFRITLSEENTDGKGSSLYLNNPVIYHLE